MGIGASAGGLEALQAFVSNLNPKIPATFVIAQHLSPHAKSMLVELLARHSKLPVHEARNNQRLRPGCICVVPPNHDVDFEDGKLRLTKLKEQIRPKPSVNHFFQSLSQAWGDKAVGIILSGTGTDGAQGISLIRAGGGLTIAQDDGSARYDGMPKSAVDTGNVDIVLPPAEMAKELENLLGMHPSSNEDRDGHNDDLLPILTLLKQKNGTDFTLYKPSTLRRRIDRQMRLAGANNYEEYLKLLEKHPSEQEKLVQETLISVTNFFRDPEAFKALHGQLEKAWAAKVGQSEFRIWVAGCATGEEAYSIAILAREALDAIGFKTPLKIFATDLDQEAILEARTGHYTKHEVRHVPDKLLAKYFAPRGDVYEVVKEIREQIVFARHDLVQSAPFVKIDLVTCRNVMIYFEPELQKRVFEIFHYALNPSGLMFLGRSEAAGEAGKLFEQVDRRAKIFRRVNTVANVIPVAQRGRIGAAHFPRRVRQAAPVQDLVNADVLAKYRVAGVVVDPNGVVAHVVGDVSSYVRLPEGQVSWNLSSMLPKGVGGEVPVLIRRVQKEGGAHRSRRYPLTDDVEFTIEARPLRDEEESEPSFFFLVFEKHEKIAMPAAPQAREGNESKKVIELEQDLMATREHLQTVIEELGISNEELQSLNEELSSTNEELQSSNEELETANEELQSSNEELTTLNEEVVNKSSEIKAASTLLENVQDSLGAPLVYVDSDLRLVRYNSLATRIFDITNADLGRDITRVACNCEIPNFHDLLIRVVESGKPDEMLVESYQHLYQLRVQPALSERGTIDGLVLVFFDNTNLIRAEERLRMSEARIRGILDSSPNPIWLKDTVGRYIMANGAFLELFGLTEKAVIGKSDREIFAPALAAQLREGDIEVLYKRAPMRVNETLTIAGRDGAPGDRIFTVSRFPLMDEEQKSPYAVGTVALETTKEVLAQRALTESEARYRAIVEDQAVLVCRLLPDGSVTFVNSAFAEYFDREPEYFVGRRLSEISLGEDRASLEHQIASLKPGAALAQFEHRAIRPHHGKRWLTWILKAIVDDSGGVREIQAVGFDITDSRRETQRLQQRDFLYKNVFDHTTDYLTVYRIDGDDFRLEDFNLSADKLHGHLLEEMRGESLRRFRHVGDISRALEAFARVARTKEPYIMENTWRFPDGDRFLSSTMVPILDDAGKVTKIALVTRDLSRFKTIEDELRAEKDRAENASRSKSDFLASMSHELRTPLNIVLGMSELLAEKETDKDKARLIASIQNSGRVLLTLIEDVLDLSKIEAGKLKLEYRDFRIFDLVQEVSDSFNLQASSRGLYLKVSTSTPADLVVNGDPDRIRQVLNNLVSNALKFTEKGGVSINLSTQPMGERNMQGLRVEVVDTGIGIPVTEHARIFQRFSQVDSGSNRRYGGTGLGLAICRRLIESMGGKIGFDSESGAGSKFWFELELEMHAHLGPAPVSRRQESVPEVSPARILVVDDNEDSRWLVNHFVTALGHNVEEAVDGLNALEKVGQAAFDMIFMDVQMPGLDGFQTTAKIREQDHLRNLPIIALTANAMAGDARRCKEAGMNDYLSKPIDKESLRQTIAKWSRNEQRND